MASKQNEAWHCHTFFKEDQKKTQQRRQHRAAKITWFVVVVCCVFDRAAPLGVPHAPPSSSSNNARRNTHAVFRPPLSIQPASVFDVFGMSQCVVEAFHPTTTSKTTPDANPATTLLKRAAWAVAFSRRLRAAKTGELRPHVLLCARDAIGVVGVSEIGLLPAPPGIRYDRQRTASRNNTANAEWRGVARWNLRAFACDVPTIANVAVAKRARRNKVGTALVEYAASVLRDDSWWRHASSGAAPDFLYARVTAPEALAFWRANGFDKLPEVPAGVSDVRGAAGVWLALPLTPQDTSTPNVADSGTASPSSSSQ